MTGPVTCRFCGHRRHRARMFHWFGDVWECRDLIRCEAAQKIKLAPPNVCELESTP